jgi:Fe-S cluster assembly protein SufD
LSNTTAPPSDLAPRVISNDPALHEVPNGREEEWRFTPIKQVADFFQSQEWASIGAKDAQFVTVRPGDHDSVIETGHRVAGDRSAVGVGEVAGNTGSEHRDPGRARQPTK